MAKHNILFIDMTIPDSDGARRVVRQDSTTIAVNFPGWAFSPSSDEFMDFFMIAGHDFDNSKDIELVLTAMSASGTSGNVTFTGELKLQDDGDDIDTNDVSSGYLSATGGTWTNPGTSAGKLAEATLVFAAASHGISAGDRFHVRLGRDSTDGLSTDVYVIWPRFQEAS